MEQTREQLRQGRRELNFKTAEIREEMQDNNKKRYVRGYALLFNSPTKTYGDWQEIIDPKAMDGVDISNVVMLVAHNTSLVIARVGVNLRVEIDDKGVFCEAELGDTYIDDYVWDRVSKGIIDGMSFAFYADIWETDTEKKIDRIMHFSEVMEVTIAAFPVYKDTVIVAVEETEGQGGEQREETPQNNTRMDAVMRYIETL